MPVSSKMNVDIEEERKLVKLNVDEFTNWYHGGKDKVEEKRFLENYFLNDPELEDKIPTSYLSHAEVYEEAVRKLPIAMKKLKALQSQGRYGKELNSKVLGATFQKFIWKQGCPVGVHYDMFIPALLNLGTAEQQKLWVDKSYDCEMIGAYAQTELGHGTFIRGLETTATFDPKTKEFVMHSPSITAYKWWPGGLAHTANYAIVFAQLYSLGKNHGVHAFLVQLREENTHKPLKGITIGEIGTKIGFNSVNNGFLGFDNVRIPMNHMLMKNAQILENGQFKKSKSSLLAYGTMTYIRVGIIIELTMFMANAVTIATRYSLVRRQSPIDPNKPEPKIIDHVTQQMKIFPAIAKTIALKMTANYMWQNYLDVMSELERGDLTRLPELHALSCCLKAVCTVEAAQIVETCRLSCGGHGYLDSAGFSGIYGCVVAAQHYEGDNTVLLLQTARYLMKAWGQALKGQNLPPTVDYLRTYASKGKIRETWGGCQNGMLRALQATAAGKIASAFKSLEARKRTLSPEEAANQTGVELTKAAELHCQVFLLHSATVSIENACKKVSESLSSVLKDILEVYSVDLVLRMMGSLMEFVDIGSNEIEALTSRLHAGLKSLRPNAIGIVDGFDIPDRILGSTLGAFDGNVYERLLDAAKKSPLNQEDVNKSFNLYLKPFMRSNL